MAKYKRAKLAKLAQDNPPYKKLDAVIKKVVLAHYISPTVMLYQGKPFRWVTNCDLQDVPSYILKFKKNGDVVSGRPKASSTYTTDQLEKMNVAGIYCYP